MKFLFNSFRTFLFCSILATLLIFLSFTISKAEKKTFDTSQPGAVKATGKTFFVKSIIVPLYCFATMDHFIDIKIVTDNKLVVENHFLVSTNYIIVYTNKAAEYRKTFFKNPNIYNWCFKSPYSLNTCPANIKINLPVKIGLNPERALLARSNC